jgi:hypothetical protein
MRGINRVASGLLGLVLIAFGLLVVLEMVVIAVGATPLWFRLDRWYGTLMRTTLANRAFLITSIVVGVVGLLILAPQLRRWRPDRLIAGREDTTPWWLSRRSVERRAATMAETVAGVSHARAKARGRPKRWHLRVRARGLPERRDEVDRAVREELARLDVDESTKVEVVLRERARRVA